MEEKIEGIWRELSEGTKVLRKSEVVVECSDTRVITGLPLLDDSFYFRIFEVLALERDV